MPYEACVHMIDSMNSMKTTIDAYLARLSKASGPVCETITASRPPHREKKPRPASQRNLAQFLVRASPLRDPVRRVKFEIHRHASLHDDFFRSLLQRDGGESHPRGTRFPRGRGEGGIMH